MPRMERSEIILEEWFGKGGGGGFDPARAKLWFSKDEEFDAHLRRRFGDDLRRAAAGEYDEWAKTPRGRLALVILLDQFSRNIHRGTKEAFANDEKARALVEEGLSDRVDREYRPIERAFFYLPLEHAEDPAAQARAVELYEELLDDVPKEQRPTYEEFLDYAVQHQRIIDRFGRFPHRNEILGRETTEEEAAFLKTPGSSF